MKTAEQTPQPSLAQCVAGEDLHIDEYVAVLNTTGEYLSMAWDRCELPPDEVVRVRYIPGFAGQPLKIIGICLPFVYVRRSTEAVDVIDLRLTQVVRLDKDCAKEIWKHTKLRPAMRIS